MIIYNYKSFSSTTSAIPSCFQNDFPGINLLRGYSLSYELGHP